MENKIKYASDEELLTLDKFMTQQEMSKKLHLSQQAISLRLIRIKKRQKSKTKSSSTTIDIDPKKLGAVDTIELAYSLLVGEKDKDIAPNVKVNIARELTRIAQTKATIRDKLSLEQGFERICNRPREILKEADPATAEKISTFILQDKELSWLITGKEPLKVSEEEETTVEKEEKDPNIKFDADLL